MKKLFTQVVEDMDEIPAEAGPALKMIGAVLQEQWMTRHGVYLNEDERKENKDPIACVEDTVISIRMAGMKYTLKPADGSKPAVVIPVGMSDKRNTCSIPRDWLTGCWIDALIEVFEGNAEIAHRFAERVNGAIDAAMTVDENGRMSVKQSDLPAHKNAVDVAEITNSMKRHFQGKSAGSPKVNMILECEPIGGVKPSVTKEETMAEQRDRLLNLLIDVNQEMYNPSEASAEEVTTGDPQDSIPIHVSTQVSALQGEETGQTHPKVEAETIPVSAPVGLEQALVDFDNRVNIGLLAAINNSGVTEGPTWGQIKKTALADGSLEKDEVDMARKMLDKLVKEKLVNKEGVRRSTRYWLTGSGLELLVGMALPDVINQDLEFESISPKPKAWEIEDHREYRIRLFYESGEVIDDYHSWDYSDICGKNGELYYSYEAWYGEIKDTYTKMADDFISFNESIADGDLVTKKIAMLDLIETSEFEYVDGILKGKTETHKLTTVYASNGTVAHYDENYFADSTSGPIGIEDLKQEFVSTDGINIAEDEPDVEYTPTTTCEGCGGEIIPEGVTELNWEPENGLCAMELDECSYFNCKWCKEYRIEDAIPFKMMTPVGVKSFCCEASYCNYVGIEYSGIEGQFVDSYVLDTPEDVKTHNQRLGNAIDMDVDAPDYLGLI